MIKIEDKNDIYYIGVSCKYNFDNNKWSIKCLNYDEKRIYYQHRLIGLKNNHKLYCQYKDLAKYNAEKYKLDIM